MLLPTAFFAALDNDSANRGLPPPFVPLVSDVVRQDILRMSRGISVILLVMRVAFLTRGEPSLIENGAHSYVVSRVFHHGYPHNTSSKHTTSSVHASSTAAPTALSPSTTPLSGTASPPATTSPAATTLPPPGTAPPLATGSRSESSPSPSSSMPQPTPSTPVRPCTKCTHSTGLEHDDNVPIHPVVCGLLLLFAVALMAVTAEFVSITLLLGIQSLNVGLQLVSSIEPIRQRSGIETEYVPFLLVIQAVEAHYAMDS